MAGPVTLKWRSWASSLTAEPLFFYQPFQRLFPRF